MIAAGLSASPVMAQVPVPPSGPVVGPQCDCQSAQHKGPIHRAAAHIKHKLHEHVIGDPALFVEPPLGYSLNETFDQMKSRADMHDFILYKSDFVNDTAQLSPRGAERLTRMSRRLDYWLGPIQVEWTPDTPGLAEQRRAAVIGLLANAGMPVVDQRVTIGPSPYYGLDGNDAGLSYPIMIQRDARAASLYPIPPIPVNIPGAGGVR